MRMHRSPEKFRPSGSGGLARGAAVVLALLAALVLLPVVAHAGGEDQELRCLALTIYHEARGESDLGKLAVGHVVMNRTHSRGFPASVCGVVQQGGETRHRCQFSWWCDGRSDRAKDAAALRESLRVAESIYDGCSSDPTAGALWFHRISVRPAWARSMGPGKRIGRHLFYRGRPEHAFRIAAAMPSPGSCARASPRPTAQLAGG